MEVSVMTTMFSGLDNLLPLRTSSGKVNEQRPPRSAPNLLQRSMLQRAVKRQVPEDRKALVYSSSGHRCWSSIRTREWQELQRMLHEEDQQHSDNKRYSSNNSYLYFSPSRASKKSSRKQMATPDSDYYQKERNKDFRRIEEALSTLRFMKQQKRQDYLSGVPTEFFNKTKEEVSEDDIEDAADVPKTADTDKTVPPSRATSRPSIPAFYVFPKPSDFVPKEGTKLDSVGVDWKYSTIHREQTTKCAVPSRPTAIPGTLRRTLKPVTEGLIKEGTSTRQIQGKILGVGEWPVEKVWKRKLDGVTQPLQMARADVKNIKQHKQLTAETGKKDVNNDESISMDAQSINRAESENEDQLSEVGEQYSEEGQTSPVPNI